MISPEHSVSVTLTHNSFITLMASVSGALIAFREQVGSIIEKAWVSALTAILAAVIVKSLTWGWDKLKNSWTNRK